jgi:hypothetical protein
MSGVRRNSRPPASSSDTTAHSNRRRRRATWGFCGFGYVHVLRRQVATVLIRHIRGLTVRNNNFSQTVCAAGRGGGDPQKVGEPRKVVGQIEVWMVEEMNARRWEW